MPLTVERDDRILWAGPSEFFSASSAAAMNGPGPQM
jgi:hypothetical protein